MSDSERYNGWTNYETWCVNLWLDNDEGMAAEKARICGQRELYVSQRGDELREFIESLPECEPVITKATFVADLLGASLDQVDWRQIVETWVADNPAEVAEGEGE